MSTALPIIVAAASAIAALFANTVTESAMPLEKLFPLHPDVAIPLEEFLCFISVIIFGIAAKLPFIV